MTTAIIIGGIASLLTFIIATGFGLGRDRAFYPTVMIVVASYYVLFAVTGDTSRTVLVELVIAAGFTALALAGHKYSPWLVAAALVLHGAFDLVHGALVHNAGVPANWPVFCMTYDVMVGAFLGWRLYARKGGLTA